MERNQKGRQTMRDWTVGTKLRVAEGRGVEERGSQVQGIKEACVVMSTGCYTQLMNHWTLHQKLMMYYMLAN